MLKFSTRTNYRLVTTFQRAVILVFDLIRYDITKVQAKRNGINWSLNLNEVIDFMIYLTGNFDHSGVRAFSKKINSNDVIIDVGGNIGSFCLPVSKSINGNGKIISIEPSKYAFKKLKTNLSKNDIFKDKILPIQAFVTSDGKEVPEEVYASWNVLSKDRHENHMGTLTPTVGATSFSLDELIMRKQMDRIDWIKIDVDGYELDVLNGSMGVIQRFKPGFFIELCHYSQIEFKSSVEKIVTFFEKHNYSFYDLAGKDLGTDLNQIEALIPKMGTTNVFVISND